jgi:uncharacterized membrane protein YjgN (DUF898 family)
VSNDMEDTPPRPQGGGASVGQLVLETPAAAVPPSSPTTCVTRPTFTGRGGEYFRIWVVNLLFTLVSLGAYSAWAKVRKAKYFRQNTRLDGHVFDYHANPVAILRGRVIAVVLLTGYSWAYQFSDAAGLITAGVLCVLGPAVLMRAQQFALSNTSFRGLRFGFRARMGHAYLTLFPVVALWVAPAAGVALRIETLWVVAASALTLPWMHHRLKTFQRRNAFYGASAFTFAPTPLRFYWIYLKGAVLVLVGPLLIALAMAVWLIWQPRADPWIGSSRLTMWLSGALVSLVVYIAAGPYYAARLQQLIWSRTRLGDVQFSTEIQAWPLFCLVVKNVALTLITAGMYWPWAAVAMARYRIECMRIESSLPLSALATNLEAPAVSATGEAAADAFGIDIGL